MKMFTDRLPTYKMYVLTQMYVSAPNWVSVFAGNFSLLPEAHPHPTRQDKHNGNQLKSEITNLARKDFVKAVKVMLEDSRDHLGSH